MTTRVDLQQHKTVGMQMCVGSVGELCEFEDAQRVIVKLRDYSGENVAHKLFMLAPS